jgi:hypothetical protein
MERGKQTTHWSYEHLAPTVPGNALLSASPRLDQSFRQSIAIRSSANATLLAAAASVKIARRRIRRERSTGSPLDHGFGFLFLVRF